MTAILLCTRSLDSLQNVGKSAVAMATFSLFVCVCVCMWMCVYFVGMCVCFDDYVVGTKANWVVKLAKEEAF